MAEPHANEVLTGLWIGDKFAASDPAFLERTGITAVFNCTKDFPFVECVARKYRVPVNDNLEESEINNMYVWAPEIIYKVIKEYKNGSRILIHCHAGRQRSAAVMVMTLMALKGIPAEEAMNFLREKRPVAFFPFPNFKDAIYRFGKDLEARLAK